MAYKPMCHLRDESQWVQPVPGGAWFKWVYAVYKCRHLAYAIDQLKHMDAPACPRDSRCQKWRQA